jgi:serine/threonine-protein kinase HipA
MKCLCCGKEFLNTATPYELSCGWHSNCIKKFFKTKKLPDIDVSESVLEQLAFDVTAKGYTVPGVQKKLSLHLSEDSEPRLTLVNYPTGYILKPQTKEYPALPEAEFLVMQMAVATKIKTVPFALLQIGSEKREFAYITRRIDRVKVGKITKMLAMEDFCQLEGRLTDDKYKGSYERCAKVVESYSESR